MKEAKNIDELFRKKLQDFEKEPPAFLFENILLNAPNKSRKKKIMIWRISAAAAALLLAFVAGWQLNSLRENQLAQTTSTDQIKNTSANENVSVANTEKTVVISEKQIAQNDLMNHVTSKKNLHPNTAKQSGNNVLVSGNESLQSLPVKSVKQLNQINNNYAQKLQEKSNYERSVKSIDQQIMEQNHQTLMAQQKQIKQKSSWLVGAQVSPVHNVNRSSQSKNYARTMLNSESSDPVKLGGGLTVEYKPGKRWSLQSGVYYAGMEHNSVNSAYSSGSKNSVSADFGAEYLSPKVNVDATTNNLSMNSPAGVILLNSIPENLIIGNDIESKDMTSAVIVTDAEFTQNFEYIEIPVYLRYTVLDNRFGIELMGGLSSNVLVGNQTYVDTETGKSLVGKTDDMELMNYSGTLGMGFKYGLSKRLFLNIEPRFKYYLNSLNSNESVSYKPYTIGVFTGLSYQF